MNRLQTSAIHEAGHAVVADFFGLEVVGISIAEPERTADAAMMASVRVAGRLEGLVGATVLAAGQAALALAADDRFDVPAMPAAEPWHRRPITLGCLVTGDGFRSDRARIAALDLDESGAHFATDTAIKLLAREWGSVFVLSDRLLREGALSGHEVRRLLHEECQGQGRDLVVDRSVTTAGWFYGDPDQVRMLPPAVPVRRSRGVRC